MDSSVKIILHTNGGEWSKGLSGSVDCGADPVFEESAEGLNARIHGCFGAVLVLDLSLYGENHNHPTVRRIFKAGREQKILVVTKLRDQVSLYELFLKGARGFCSPDIEMDLLVKAISAVMQGELWISRKQTAYFMGRMYRESNSRVRQSTLLGSSDESLDPQLTEREIEIAKCVALGNCDKAVASSLDISPNTVKNHLRNIYQKLNVSDRVQLALICHGIDVEELWRSA